MKGEHAMNPEKGKLIHGFRLQEITPDPGNECYSISVYP
jgi:hypothetical protein